MKKTFLYNQSGAEQDIINMYSNATHTVADIAAKYYVTPRTIQRIAKKYNIVRTIAEANKVARKFKSYDWLRVSPEERKTRTSLTAKTRYELLSKYKKCTVCQSKDQLQIDHIDENPSNNALSNLQVLCRLCNAGKSQLARNK